jgi:putative transposase
MQNAQQMAKEMPITQACQALKVPRSTFYRQRHGQNKRKTAVRAKPARALSEAERENVRDILNSDRFQDKSPYQVYASLLDDKQTYLCSISSMYRILHEYDEVRERRKQRQHPHYVKPELLATQPNQLWSWDITKLLGSAKWTYYYMYVILDVFSRYVVGWLISEQESAQLAEQFIAESCFKQNICQDQLTLHADRGSSMTSKKVAHLLADLGVTKTHSRPYTSNDNPYSEAQFKTMKYRPSYPDHFGCIEDARAWANSFFHWYNNEHRHTGLGLMTPAAVHTGLATQITTQRQTTLQAAYEKHPERFVKGQPQPLQIPGKVWINPPQLAGRQSS